MTLGKRRRITHTNCVLCGHELPTLDEYGWKLNAPGRAFCSIQCAWAAEKIRNGVYAIVAAAKKLSVLPSPKGMTCADCGRVAKFYDHRDYSKPLEVEPVCHSCNVRRGPGVYPKAA